MQSTEQAQTLHRGLAAAGDGLNMVILKKPARRAAATGRAHERALALIALPDSALDVRRDMARVGARASRRPWPRGRGEFLLLELTLEGIQRAVEHLADIAGGEPVAQERLDVAELVVGFLADCEVNRKALG